MYVLSPFSFIYLPINYIRIKEDKKDKSKIAIRQKCFIKSGETYFSKSDTLFSKITKLINLKKIELISTNNVIPIVSKKQVILQTNHYLLQ